MVAGGLEIDLRGDLGALRHDPQFESATGRMHACTAVMLC